MALISIKRNVDLQPGLNAPAVFNCSQSDKGTTIMLGLMNGGNDYTVPSGVTITIRGSRSNGAVFTPASATFSGSTVSFTLTEEMTDTAGPTLCEAVLEQGNNVLGTANFIINVEGSPMGADVPPVFTDAAWTWMLGKLTTETVPALGDDVISSIQGKVDKSQGSTNAKKFLRVNTSGNVSLASTDKTLSVADQIADAKETGDQIRALDAEIDGVATTLGGSISTLNGITTDLQSSKLNKNQGTSNAGKTMVVDSSGNIVPGDVPITIDDTLSIADAAADAKAAGDAIALKANASTIAPEFSDQNTYTAGSYVYKNGVLYRFTAAHSGAWTGTDAETVTVGGELSENTNAVEETKDTLDGALNQIFNSATDSGETVIVNTFPSIAKITVQNDLDVKHTGKNILAFPYQYAEPQTINGIKYTPNADGSITVTGTATAASTYSVVHENTSLRRPIKAGTYTLSGTPEGGGRDTAYMLLSGIGQGNLFDYGSGVSFTITADKTFYLKISVLSGQTVDMTFKPMIEHGSVKTSWESYKGENIAVNENALINLFGGTDVFSADNIFAVTYYTNSTTETDTLNLKDFGAAGDGVNDDTAFIKAALVASAGKTLFIPEGIYKFSETLKIPSNTKVIGCGSTSVLKLSSTFTLTPYEWRPEDGIATSVYKYPFVQLEENTKNCVLCEFVIEGQIDAFVDQAEIALTIMGKNHIVENVVTRLINYFPDDFSGRTYNAPGEGFECFKAAKVVIRNCTAEMCGYEGIGTEKSEDIAIINCYVGDTNQTGIQIHRSSKRILVDNCTVEYSADALAGTALTLHANVGLDMDEIKISKNYLCKGVTLIGGAENNVFFTDNTIVEGALTRNGTTYRKNWFIRGNKFLNGGVVASIDDCIVTDNMLTVNTGYFMINIYGNNVTIANNVALGSVSGTRSEPHDE